MSALGSKQRCLRLMTDDHLQEAVRRRSGFCTVRIRRWDVSYAITRCRMVLSRSDPPAVIPERGFKLSERKVLGCVLI